MEVNLVYPDGRTMRVTVGPIIATGSYASIHHIVHLPHIAAKIFHQDDRYTTVRRRYLTRKLTAMTAANPPDAGPKADIAWPTALACDNRDEVLGYAMPLLHSELTPLRSSAGGGSWHPAAEAAIANIIPALQRLHLQDIVIGDISPANILADPAGQQIGLVDTDGWQFRDQSSTRLYLAQGWTHPYIPTSVRAAQRRQTMPNCVNRDCPQAGAIHSERPDNCRPRLPEHDLEALAIMARYQAANAESPA